MCRHCESNATHEEQVIHPAPASIPARGEMLPLIGEQMGLPLFGEDVGYPLPPIEARTIDGEVIPAVMVACSSCGEEHEEGSDELHEHSQNAGEFLCNDCSCSCENCGNVYASDDSEIRQAYNGERSGQRGEQYRCVSCSWRCADCRDYFYGAASSNASGDDICQSCSENYTCCESCNDTISNDDSRFDDESEQCLCQSCYGTLISDREGDEEQDGDDEEASPPPSPESTQVINAYSYKPRARFAFAAGEERSTYAPAVFYGLEIETEHSDVEVSHASAIRSSGLAEDKQFYCKRDNSLSNGFEIVSHPATFRFWQSHEFAFCDELMERGYGSDVKSCGLHIHVSRSALSTPQITKLLLFSKANSEFMKYASNRVSSAQMDGYAPIEHKSTRSLLRKAIRGNSHEERYAAINLENDATIEFRLFQGTLDASRIKRTLAFVACLLEFIRQAPLTRLTEGDFRSFIVLNGRRIVGKSLTSALVTWLSGTLADAA